MTVLGKVLVFFVLFLSLVWTGLTMNAFVTRTNWKTAYDAAAAEVTKANAALAEQERYATQQKASADVVIAQQREEIGRLTRRATEVTAQLADANNKLTAKIAGEQAQDAPTRLLQNDLKKLQNQVDLLQGEQTKSEQAVNASTIARQKALDDKLQADIDRDAARRRADELEKANLRLTEPGGGRPGERTPIVDPDFRATVQKVTGDYVEINLGSGAGLQRGAVLSISRTSPAPRYVGSLRITRVDPYTAVGQFVPLTGQRNPTGDALPRAGDTVSVLR